MDIRLETSDVGTAEKGLSHLPPAEQGSDPRMVNQDHKPERLRHSWRKGEQIQATQCVVCTSALPGSMWPISRPLNRDLHLTTSPGDLLTQSKVQKPLE